MSIFIVFGLDYVCRDYLTTGWSIPEIGLVWSTARKSRLTLPRGRIEADVCLRLTLRPFISPRQPYQCVTINVNGCAVGQMVLRQEEENFEFFVARQQMERGEMIEIDFYHHSPQQPAAEINSSDTRLLSVALIELELCSLAQAPPDNSLQANNLIDADDGARLILFREREADKQSLIKLLTLSPGVPLSRVIEAFIRGLGVQEHSRAWFREEITERARADSCFADHYGPAILANGDLSRPMVEMFAPRFARFLFDYADELAIERSELLGESENEWYFPEFPGPFAVGLTRGSRPALQLLSPAEPTDAYVGPYCYAIYERHTQKVWIDSNPQSLSRLVLWEPAYAHDGDLVIVQDQFDGGNLAHLLFDYLTRLYHYVAARPEHASRALFVFGGWPGEFQRLMTEAAAVQLGLSRQQFLFARQGANIRPAGRVYWFSDQTHYQHPAQMMHPVSVAALRRLCGQVMPGGESTGRLYISRSDSDRRRLRNEPQLTELLRPLGFKVLRLADLAVADQIRAVGNASCVVAPHGMGLTHLAFNRGAPSVVELFSPLVGSDAYAFLSRALGFDYHPLVGELAEGKAQDFLVEVDAVMSALAACGVA